jgi:hypothetical protein
MDKQLQKSSQETRRPRHRNLRYALRLVCAACLLPFAAASAQGLPFTESFDNGNFKDPDTTADWETTPGDLTLPLAGSNLVQSLNGALEATDSATVVDVSEDARSRAVALGDLDGDGDLDIAFGNNGPNSIYFNDGVGGFVRGSSIPGINDHFGSGNTRSAAIADFNGDGHLDVAFAEFGETQASRVLFNNGAGAPQIFDAGDFADLGPASIKGDSLAIGDIDDDGDIDVVIGALGSYVQVLENDGFGNFADPVSVADPLPVFGFHPRTVALGDLDRNGRLDIVAALEFGTNRIYLQNLDGSFAAPQDAGTGEVNKLDSPDTVSLGDINGDGWLDLVVGNDGSGLNGEPNRIYLNSTVPGALFPAVSAQFGGMNNTNSARLADVDRDGDLDIVTGEMLDLTQPAANLLFVNDGTGTFAAGTSITASVDVTKSVALGDLNGNGQLDVVFANDPETVGGNPVAGTAVNEAVLNDGVLSGTAADQLYATALSIRVDNAEDLSGGVRLEPTVTNVPANPALSYWMSADGGSRWVSVQPGQAVSFPAGGSQDLRWRIDFNTLSTAALWRPSVASLSILANGPARINSTEVTDATQDVEYSYTVTAVDPDGDDIEIRAASTLPTWLTLTDNGDGTALLSGTPSNDDWLAGPDYVVTIEAVDGSQVVGAQGSQEFTITVANVNDAPEATVPTGDQVFAQGDVVNLDVGAAFQDVDGDTMTFSANGLPASLAIDPATGVISGTLTNDDAINGPDYAVVVTADDGNTGTGQDAFTLTVNNDNDPPTIDSTPTTGVIVGQAYTYAITASDIDGDALVISVSGQPAWLTFTDNGDGTATLTGTPAAGDEGASNITVTVDDATVQVTQDYTLTVTAANTAPTITVLGDNPATIEAGDTYTDAGATASDAQDGDLTSGISVDNPVDATTPGTYTVTYTVTDSGGLTATATRTVNVVEANTAPTITVLGDNPVNLTTGDSYTDAGATAADAQDGDLTSVIAVDNPVDTSAAGTYTVTYTVTDSGGLSASATRTVVVTSPPPPPPPPPTSSGGGGGSFGPLGLLLVGTFLLAARRRRIRT